MFEDINHLNIYGGSFIQNNNIRQTRNYDLEASIRSPDFIRRLRPPHYVKDLLIPNQRARVPTTCLWSVDNPIIKAWLDPQEPLYRLWLFGRPGTGKSVLAAFIVDRVLGQHNAQEEITLYYFCKNKNDTPVHVLKDFIRQFFQRKDRLPHPDVAEFVEAIFSQRIEYEFSMEEIKPYFHKFLGLFKRKWFIMDGLDECQEPDALIRALVELPDSRILVLSRKERYIEVELRDWGMLEIGTASTTEGDLEVFITDQVHSLVQRYQFLQAEFEHIKDTILAKSAGMFQYAHVVCETLKRQTSHAAIRRTLETIPSDLMDLYNDYLSQRLAANSISDNEVALRALQWIIHSPHPLSLNCLGQALIVDLAEVHEKTDVEFLVDIKSRISDAVGILVQWHKSDQDYYKPEPTGSYFASLAHQSIREYFLNLKLRSDEKSKDTKKWWGDLDLPYNSLISSSAHSAILSTCVVVMTRAKIWEAVREYHDSADRRRRVCPTDRNRLDRQLCRNRSWSLWETDQLDRLEKDRNWRKAEAASLHMALQEVTEDLDGMEWVRNSRGRLEMIVQAEHPHSKEYEHRALTNILCMRERELMLYALQHVGKHLCETDTLGNKLLMNTFSELVPKWRKYGHSILCQVETTLLPVGHKSFYTRDLITALEAFSVILEVIERLPHSRSINIFDVFRLVLASHSALASDSSSSLVWNAEIMHSLEASQAPRRFRLLLSIITNLIISLNNIELALFNYDTGVKPLVGTGILLHSVWYCKQTLAQWIVSQNLCHLDPQQELLRSDDYLFPKLLLSLPNVGHPPPHLYPDQSTFNHPALVPTLLAFSVISYRNIMFPPTALLCTHLVLSRIRRYSFLPPRQVSIYLRVAKCCLLFLFALQTLPLPPTVTLVIMPVVIYGYNNTTLEQKFGYAMHSPQLQIVVNWLGRNSNLMLTLFSTCTHFPTMQLNITIIYLLFDYIIRSAIDPYRFHYVFGLYTGSETSSSLSISARI